METVNEMVYFLTEVHLNTRYKCPQIERDLEIDEWYEKQRTANVQTQEKQ